MQGSHSWNRKVTEEGWGSGHGLRKCDTVREEVIVPMEEGASRPVLVLGHYIRRGEGHARTLWDGRGVGHRVVHCDGRDIGRRWALQVHTSRAFRTRRDGHWRLWDGALHVGVPCLLGQGELLGTGPILVRWGRKKLTRTSVRLRHSVTQWTSFNCSSA